jgi:beta-fructofuranosidase
MEKPMSIHSPTGQKVRFYRKPAHADATGDAIPFYHEGKYHIFSLTPPPGTGTYPERLRTTWHHAWSENLVDWEEIGPALIPGGPGEPDADGCWTGSVIHGEGKWHAFYTGYSIQAAFQQTICHAVSDDGVSWTKDPKNPILVPKTDIYERLDWRDPYAFYNEEDRCYWLLFSARKNTGPVTRRGCVILYRSQDLTDWDYCGPIYEPKHTNCPECPELYRMGDTWYLSYSRFSEFGGTIYRVSESPFGPWRTPRHERIGNRRFYAAKSMADDMGRRYYFGWIPDRADKSDRGEWYWGGIFALPHEAGRSSKNQELEIKLPSAVAETFRDPLEWQYKPIEGDSELVDKDKIRVKAIGTLAYGFFDFPGRRYLLSCKVRPADCRDHFGFIIKSDRDLSSCLLLAFEPGAKRVSLLKYPMQVDPFWEASVASMVRAAIPGPDGPRVAETPFDFDDGAAIDVKILVEDDLVETFVGEKAALTYRCYDAGEYEIGVIVQDGNAEYEQIIVTK